MSTALKSRRATLQRLIRNYTPLNLASRSRAQLQAELDDVNRQIQTEFLTLGNRWREYCASRKVREVSMRIDLGYRR